MDRFISLTTLGDQTVANSVCSLLEGERIPVMIEHVANADQLPSNAGFRVLVPEQRSQQAMGLISFLVPAVGMDS